MTFGDVFFQRGNDSEKQRFGEMKFRENDAPPPLHSSNVIMACELSVTRLPHLSGICLIDDHEILVQGSLLISV